MGIDKTNEYQGQKHEKRTGWWDKLTTEEKAAIRLRGKLKARVKQTGMTIYNGVVMIRAVAKASKGHTGPHARIAVGSMAIVQRDRHKMRAEARCVNLAYAFLRGKPWASCEQKYKTIPNTKRIAQIIAQYSDADSRSFGQQFAEWIDAAIKSGGYVGPVQVKAPSQANPVRR